MFFISINGPCFVVASKLDYLAVAKSVPTSKNVKIWIIRITQILLGY
jgi:hypothetical protein